MKRSMALMLAMVLAVPMSVYGAEEKEVRFWKDGQEIFLEDKVLRKNGKLMLSKCDIEHLIGSKGGKGDILGFGLGDINTPVALAGQSNMAIGDRKVLEKEHQIKEVEEEFVSNRERYAPVRDVAEALGFRVTWKEENGKEYVFLETQKKMPALTVSLWYDREKDTISGMITNKEPQTFLYGGKYELSRLTENGWESVYGAQPGDIDEIGYYMTACREATGEDGISEHQWHMNKKLEKGRYRIGIPFSYRYHMNNAYSRYVNEIIEKGDLSKIDWNIYYSTHWGKPDFYFVGDGLSTYDVQKDTNYILYGEFTVE